jgi:hypothetical protein
MISRIISSLQAMRKEGKKAMLFTVRVIGCCRTALLNAVRAHAAVSGIPEIQWQTPDWNEDAARFYLPTGAAMLPKARFILRTM